MLLVMHSYRSIPFELSRSFQINTNSSGNYRQMKRFVRSTDTLATTMKK